MIEDCFPSGSVKDGIGLSSMKRALLEIMVSGIAVTQQDVERYAKCTFLHTCMAHLSDCDAEEAINSTVKYLVDNEFVAVRKEKEVGRDFRLGL